MPERPTGRAPRLRAGRGLRSLRPRAQKVVETKVQTCDGAAHKSSRLESFLRLEMRRIWHILYLVIYCGNLVGRPDLPVLTEAHSLSS